LSVRAPATQKGPDPHEILFAEFLAAAGPGHDLPAPVSVEIAFAGRSNAGKSSLINTLTRRKNLVRTSATPGSTRSLHLYETRARDGTVLHFVDLPGYGFTKRSKAERNSWAALIEGYLGRRVSLAAVVIVTDIRRGLEQDDRELIAFIEGAREAQRRPIEVVLVATKIDKIPLAARRIELDKIRRAVGRRVLGFSAVTGEGRDELLRLLRRAALGDPGVNPGGDAVV
jgi:GTP-binding protein